MEVTTQKINTNIKYKHEYQEEICSVVVKNFEAWDDDRQTQLTLIEKVADLLDMSESVKKEEIGNEKESKLLALKDADIKEICNSMVAHAYNANFKTPSQMFNVELETETSESEKANFAYMQKAVLLNAWKKSKAKAEARKCINNIYKKGECILYVNWKQDYENVRRKVGFEFLGINLKKWEVSRQLKFDGVKLKSIDPENFVFDTSAVDFESAAKIYKSWVTYSDIANNEVYKQYLKKDDLKELKEATENAEPQNDNVKIDSEEDKAFKDKMIECLEYQGDISVLENGETKFYPNMKVVVVARKYVACFMYNPNINNSFVWFAPDIDPKTGRGIPPLACLIPMSEATTETLNKVNKALGLTINKCYLTPRGVFKDDIEVQENGIIEYDAALMSVPPVPLDFASGLQYGIQFLEYTEGKKEQATGRFKYSTGDTGTPKKTLGEAKLIQSGQDALLAYENDQIADFIITTIEKMAQLEANFRDKPINLKYKDASGAEQNGIIDETVIQGNYIYTIGDTQTSVEKKMNGLEAMQSLPQIQELLRSQGKTLDVNKVVEMWGSIYEQENPTQIIAQEEPKPPPPEPNAITAELAMQVIDKLKLPDNIKLAFAQEAGLLPKGGESEPRAEAEINQGIPPMPDGNIQDIPPAIQSGDLQPNINPIQ
jgi:hypothetical protein